MISGHLQHNLAFAIRFNNHFTGEPVDDELPVRLDHSFTRPVRAPGNGYRQADGTYRFIDLHAGVHHIRWLPALQHSCKGWVSWEQDPEVQVPLDDPGTLITRDLWPEASAAVDTGVTAVRGRLLGVNTFDLSVHISNPAFPSTRFTRSNASGDFLYLLTGPVETNTAGLLELDIEVADGARNVTGGEFVPDDSGTAFPAAAGDPPDHFSVLPGRCSRVLFHVT